MDQVNHPSHYCSHSSGIECIDIIEHLPFNTAAAIKYLWRKDLKGKKDEDINKALWFLEREIQKTRITRDFFDKLDDFYKHDPEDQISQIIYLIATAPYVVGSMSEKYEDAIRMIRELK
jgi:hypothetical protein